MSIYRLLIPFWLLQLFVAPLFAQRSYYSSINGVKGGAPLKSALCELVGRHNRISYGTGKNSVWWAFYVTDAVEGNKKQVVDIYSQTPRYFTDRGSSVAGMHIEHCVPKSWWGGDKNDAYCDLHHLFPADASANIRKSNKPLGNLVDVSWTNGAASIGKALIEDSLQAAFEPCDEYKGDFARAYMYIFTCYQDFEWEHTAMNYKNSAYPTIKPWAVELLLDWHAKDPVSAKEKERNELVYAIQNNRNPFVDYPNLADYVWGDSIAYTYTLPCVNGNPQKENNALSCLLSSDSRKRPEYLCCLSYMLQKADDRQECAAAALINVYSMTGLLILDSVTYVEALNALPPGLYLVDNRKFIVY
ncbi:MAG: endonuclease [Bacteroidaceae bacterium]|nr:endonuclease [Bacteroidaceae bacterium]